MKTKLIALTKPIIDVNNRELTPEELIVYIARVSSPKNQENIETSPKLINYLIRKKHWSPFEMVDMTIEVETSRALAAQILRHWFDVQEFSQRYAEAESYEMYKPRRQDPTNRQSSIDDLPQVTTEWFQWAQNKVWELSYGLYKQALGYEIAKEDARFLLPLATTTKMYLKGSIRNWIHYIQARTSEEAQWHHKVIALACKDIFKEHFPIISEAIYE
jgi:thymidylate synthase (FAD)